MGIDILGIDILGIDILGIDTLAPTHHNSHNKLLPYTFSVLTVLV